VIAGIPGTEVLVGTDVVCLGEIVVDLVAGGSEVGFPVSFFPTPGGAAVNVAVALRRLGVRSALLGRVGGDAFGRFLQESLGKEGVDLRGLVSDEKESTALTFVLRKDPVSREPVFVRYGAADMGFRREEVCWEVLQEARVLHLVSLCLVREPLRDATWEILNFCAQRGILVSFDVNHRPRLWKDPHESRKLILQVIEKADFLKLTREELSFLTGYRDLREGARVLLKRGVKNCVITLGKEGAFFANHRGEGFVPAFPVITVDPVGCGDAFCAGFLKKALSRSVEKGGAFPSEQFCEMVVFASACGAFAAQGWGATPSFPTLTEVEAFLQEKSSPGN